MNLENNFPEKIEFQLLFCFFLVLYISCSPVKEEITPITEITPLKKRYRVLHTRQGLCRHEHRITCGLKKAYKINSYLAATAWKLEENDEKAER